MKSLTAFVSIAFVAGLATASQPPRVISVFSFGTLPACLNRSQNGCQATDTGYMGSDGKTRETRVLSGGLTRAHAV